MTSYRFSRWRISAILDFRGPVMGSLKSPCTISYRSSIVTIALNCLVFEKIAFRFAFWRQTDEQMDSTDALSRSHYRERRLNNMKLVNWPLIGGLLHFGIARGRSPPRLLLVVPNVTAHPSSASLPITVLLYGPLFCDFSVPINGQYTMNHSDSLNRPTLQCISAVN